MYNRYIPGTGGVYERRIVEEPKKQPPCPAVKEEPAPEPPENCSTPPQKPCRPAAPGRGLDLGDLLVLAVILLMMLDSDGEEDLTAVLITAAAFLLLP